MKSAIAIAAAALVTFGAAAPASAYNLTPENSSFTGNGKTSATKSGVTLPCKANLAGSIDGSGVGSVTSGHFKGQLGCSSVTLTGLPWTATATGATKGVIHNVGFSSPIGRCGPSDLPIKIKDGVIKFSNVTLAGDCPISGKIK